MVQVEKGRPQGIGAAARQRRKRGIALASSGLALGLVVGLCLRQLGISSLTMAEWWSAVALTLLVQGTLWLIPHFGLDARLTWDRHYIYLPMLGAALVLSYYGYVVYEARVLVLLAWQIGLLFVAGRVGFRGVTGLSLVMVGGYLAGVLLEHRRGLPVSLAFEFTVVASFVAMMLYAAVIFERLRQERRETAELRRRLTELALTDALTGLPNRRQLEETLHGELARIRRHGGSCSLVMVDVDHFKQYNDRHGHPAGDGALRRLAAVIREHMRTGDVAARYGGEEFAVILFNVPGAGARVMMERLRAAVEALAFDEPGAGAARLTISAGIASCPADASEFEPLLRLADAALYAAKEAGRNRVCGAQAPGS